MLIKERWYEEIGPRMHCHSFILTGALSSVDLLATCGYQAAQSCITYTYFLNIMVATHSLVPRPSHTAFFRSHGKKVCQAFPQLFYSRAKKCARFFFYGCEKNRCGKAWHTFFSMAAKNAVWEGLGTRLSHTIMHGFTFYIHMQDGSIQPIDNFTVYLHGVKVSSFLHDIVGRVSITAYYCTASLPCTV